MFAFSPNNNEIHIYETRTWTLLWKLTEHDMLVSSIDWSPVSNKIVSCSHDRNAFVWTFESANNNWKPSLVILRIDRAALDVKWSADGKRFAVASGAKCVPVCTYEQSNDWWVCKMIKKKFKSTVLCVDFHPANGQLLATGCADFKCRVYSTFSSEVDGTTVNSGPFANFSGPVEFGETYLELSASGWVHAVAWSPSGNILAYASHDSTVHFATLGVSAEPPVQVVRLNDLPFSSLLFLNEHALLGAGYDFNPTVITNSKGQWAFNSVLDKAEEKTAAADEGASNTSRARELFKSKTARGQDIKSDCDVLKTKHERQITHIRNAAGSRNGSISSVSTTGMDGKLVMWNLSSLEATFSKLSL